MLENKKGREFTYEGPMIGHVNDTIERTHRLIGMPRSEVFRRGVIRQEIPLYGVAGLSAAGLAKVMRQNPLDSGS